MEWTTAAVERLVMFYQLNPFMYDTLTADYHNRTKRRAAVEAVGKELGVKSKLFCKYSCVVNDKQYTHDLN